MLALLYPPRCPLCRRELARPRREGFCRACLSRLEPLPPGCARCAEPGATLDVLCARCHSSPPSFHAARAALLYRPVDALGARTAITRWKYDGDLRLGAALAARFASWGAAQARDFEAIVPVPLERSRLAARGFNQAAVLARALAEMCQRPVVHALARTRFESSQTALGRIGRRENVAGRFRIRGRDPVRGRRVVLVDDVLTSGATADECARVLLAAGALRIDVWTLARAGHGILLPERPPRLPSAVGGASVPLGLTVAADVGRSRCSSLL